MSDLSPLFFLSYARSTRPATPPGRDGDRWVHRLFEDLSEMVSQFVGRAVGADPGFMDNGADWSARLSARLGTCQVFVALLSPPYFESRWCSWEWAAFERRPVRDRATGAPSERSAILPVRWLGWPSEASVPAAIRNVQYFTPDLADAGVVARYAQRGLLDLQMTGDPGYDAVVWRLAGQIAEVYHSCDVEPKIPDRRDPLPTLWEPG